MNRIGKRDQPTPFHDPNQPNYWDPRRNSPSKSNGFRHLPWLPPVLQSVPLVSGPVQGGDAKGDDVRNLTTRREGSRHRPLLRMQAVRGQVSVHAARQPRVFSSISRPLVLRARRGQGAREGLGCARRCSESGSDGEGWQQSTGLANWSCRNALQRRVMESCSAIHRDKPSCRICRRDFREMDRTPRACRRPGRTRGERWLSFPHLLPSIIKTPRRGKALVTVLEKNCCAIASPPQELLWDAGLDGVDVAFATKAGRSQRRVAATARASRLQDCRDQIRPAR